jgi:hypothetical protein
VRDGHDHGRGNLGICPQMLDPVVVNSGFGVCGLEDVITVRYAVLSRA